MLNTRRASGTASFPIILSNFRGLNLIPCLSITTAIRSLNFGSCSIFICKNRNFRCRARRRVRYEDDEDEDEGVNDYNPDIAMLEMYTQSVKQEALIVRATIDDDDVEEEILIFKGFSSSLSYGTSPDPSKSILPAKAVVKSIDRVKGPFNPADIQYIEKALTLEDFKARFRPT